MDWGMSGAVFDTVFKKVKAATGGNIRLTVCGGSPLAKDTQKFLSVTHAPLLVGYGLTESSA
jgi:long-chain acyl-CoA synthetase